MTACRVMVHSTRITPCREESAICCHLFPGKENYGCLFVTKTDGVASPRGILSCHRVASVGKPADLSTTSSLLRCLDRSDPDIDRE